MHSRGNFTGFREAGPSQKWLEVHTGDHIAPFYEEEGLALLKQFYDHFLKKEDNGWEKRPPVLLDIRRADGTITRREENEWPLARTQWRKLYLDAASGALVDEVPEEPARMSYRALEDAISFTTAPLAEEIELTGPMAAKLFVESSTEDMDIFATVQAFAPDGSEVTFAGASEPAAPIAQGWLRASHRKLDPKKSKAWRPWHSHDEKEPLTPGRVYELDVEIWPTCIVLPPGYRIALTVRGKDYEYPDLDEAALLSHFKGSRMRGCGIYVHDDAEDRPNDVFGGLTTVYTGADHPSHVLLPVIPSRV